MASSPFLADYERLLQAKAQDYDQLKQSRVDENAIGHFSARPPFRKN